MLFLAKGMLTAYGNGRCILLMPLLLCLQYAEEQSMQVYAAEIKGARHDEPSSTLQRASLS